MKTKLVLALTCLNFISRAQLTYNQSIGAFSMGSSGQTSWSPPPGISRLTGTVWTGQKDLLVLRVKRYEDGHFDAVSVAITNYPNLHGVTDDEHLDIYGRRIGVAKMDNQGGQVELYDLYDLPAYRAGVIEAARAEKARQDQAKAAADKVQAQIANAKALVAIQAAATNGDAYGLLRMGERYRDGDGVEKDVTKARDYLQKAADAGSPTAKDELSKLPSSQN